MYLFVELSEDYCRVLYGSSQPCSLSREAAARQALWNRSWCEEKHAECSQANFRSRHQRKPHHLKSGPCLVVTVTSFQWPNPGGILIQEAICSEMKAKHIAIKFWFLEKNRWKSWCKRDKTPWIMFLMHPHSRGHLNIKMLPCQYRDPQC